MNKRREGLRRWARRSIRVWVLFAFVVTGAHWYRVVDRGAPFAWRPQDTQDLLFWLAIFVPLAPLLALEGLFSPPKRDDYME